MAVSVVTANVLTGQTESGSVNLGTLSLTGSVNYVVVLMAQAGSTDAGRGVTVNGVSCTELFTPPSSGGGYTGISAWGLANPGSGSVVATVGSADRVAVIAVPLAGVDTTTPFGTWVTPGDDLDTSIGTGTITGVDSTGLFLGFACVLGNTTISSYGTATQIAERIGTFNSTRELTAWAGSKAGAASDSFTLTVSGSYHASIAGVYVRSGVTSTKKLKLLVSPSAQSVSSVSGVVFQYPTGGNITGTEIGEFTGKSFEASLESGQAVLKVPVADFGGTSLTTSDTPVVLVRTSTNTTGVVTAQVIEE